MEFHARECPKGNFPGEPAQLSLRAAEAWNLNFPTLFPPLFSCFIFQEVFDRLHKIKWNIKEFFPTSSLSSPRGGILFSILASSEINFIPEIVLEKEEITWD